MALFELLITSFDYASAKATSIWSQQHAVYYGNDTEVLFRRD